MLHLSYDFIKENGGLLVGLRKKCYLYINQIIIKNRALKWQTLDLSKLDRTITHAHPHLDEYYADLLIRSTLPSDKMNIDFLELAIQSENDDSTCKAYFQNAIVLGIGANVSGGATPLKIYDEHQVDGGRLEDSCSELVSKDKFKKTPWALKILLKEVNELDANGGAHTQHISNIIKSGHLVRFLHKKTTDYYQNIQGWLSPLWKKTIMDVSITAVIYCLENKINLSEYTVDHEKWLIGTLNHYKENSEFQTDSNFIKTINRLKDTYSNQKVVYRTAKLPKSKKSNQLLVLGKVCAALFYCWGEKIATIMMIHYWEMVYQTQAVFNDVTDELNKLHKTNDSIVHSLYGTIEKKILFTQIRANNSRRITIPKNFHHQLWVLEAEITPRLIMGNRPLINFLNKQNLGFGIIFLNDKFNCTKALFKGSTFPHNQWRKLVRILCDFEPKCWHDTSETASFLINGNRSHAYVPLSQIELPDLINIITNL